MDVISCSEKLKYIANKNRDKCIMDGLDAHKNWENKHSVEQISEVG